MSRYRVINIGAIMAVFLAGLACETTIQTTFLGEDGASPFPAPDGIDPRNPHIERSTRWLDFEGTETVRVEIPTGRVTISQSNGSSGATLKVTEYILVEGLGYEVLAALLTGSAITAERSFVDHARLDIEATIAEGLANEDVVFDVRLVIPSGANVEILLANGPVEVVDLTGNVEIRTANGDVVVDHVSGNVVAHTSGRSIQAIDVVGDVHAETDDGDITMRLAPPDGGKIFAATTEGSINLSVARSTAANVSLIASEGVVSANLSGFVVSDVATSSGLLTSVLNGGGNGRIEARTTGGEITFDGV